MKKKLIIILGVVVTIILVLGVKFYMDEKKLDEEMMEVVYSDEAKEVFEERLANLDPKAFTKEGVIQSYEIDKESIERNPMGGINVTLIINGNSELYVKYTLNNFNGELSGGASVTSEKFTKLLGDWEENK
ncbi:DUF1310 domain-containing protein [Listeria seeligeri]|uniref:DUF1310 family protein n=1 Tax=Listeria seeligeri TaxID=1640 RepID=UPI001623D576|nr:DUF1310 family protein [Listeria seeligeri]MBC1526931.1 DUF1310 domain-containing protein [Listeria seeligeri]MBC1725138.1 DUF1310 domain-containing protein [Listeria seeligeri]MBC1728932.1 DUF1310 domain-containing protein [Listeria seeligeri]MBC1734793.1 DUF1310 domain-containing protein [Listeria seeligeri]MBC1849436.1 DUF1310 domain-containing protein [Listeria seeligeri]